MSFVHFKEGTWVYWKHFWQRRWFPWGGDVIIGLGNAPPLNLTISEDRFLSCTLLHCIFYLESRSVNINFTLIIKIGAEKKKAILLVTLNFLRFYFIQNRGMENVAWTFSHPNIHVSHEQNRKENTSHCVDDKRFPRSFQCKKCESFTEYQILITLTFSEQYCISSLFFEPSSFINFKDAFQSFDKTKIEHVMTR